MFDSRHLQCCHGPNLNLQQNRFIVTTNRDLRVSQPQLYVLPDTLNNIAICIGALVWHGIGERRARGPHSTSRALWRLPPKPSHRAPPERKLHFLSGTSNRKIPEVCSLLLLAAYVPSRAQKPPRIQDTSICKGVADAMGINFLHRW